MAQIGPIAKSRKPIDIAALRAVSGGTKKQSEPDAARRMRDQDRY